MVKTKAYEEGRAAYKAGKSTLDNPYNVLWKEFGQWLQGYYSWAN